MWKCCAMAAALRALSSSARKFSCSAVKQSQIIQQEGIPGSNLPFDIHNKKKLTAVFILYFSSGLTLPLLILRHTLLQKYSSPNAISKPTSTTIKPLYDGDEAELENGVII
uniref:Cytochrome c oxidase subunit 7C, mitochondrial n=1 Tax=Biomphalaria glabrata TaxID=6526 RepID=A0A2C9LWF2_BIOGL